MKEAQELAANGNLRLPFRLLGPALASLAAGADTGVAEERFHRAPNGLHQRETQILRLLEQGLRNKDIAARLFLSEETVKWYLKRLYGNFEVGNRLQLLVKVRRLGMLSEIIA